MGFHEAGNPDRAPRAASHPVGPAAAAALDARRDLFLHLTAPTRRCRRPRAVSAALLKEAACRRGTTVETEAAVLVNRTARAAVAPGHRLRDVPPGEGRHPAGVIPRLRGH